MNRIRWSLLAFGLLTLAAVPAMANEPYHHHSYHPQPVIHSWHHHGHHNGYGPVVIVPPRPVYYSPVYVAPRYPQCEYPVPYDTWYGPRVYVNVGF